MNSKTFKKELWFILGVLVLAFLISLTNPLNPFNKSGYIKIDSSVFAYIGKAMYEYKQIPYVDLFDHKGLFLYFINYAGYALAGLHGIWFIELIFNTLSLYLVFKISSLFSNNKYISIFTTLVISVLFVQYNSGGNFSETYAFPIILGALFILNKYLLQRRQKTSSIQILFLGFLFGLILMLRPNMIGVWIGFLLTILINFTINKNFKKIFLWILFFVVGSIISVIPFFIYLASHNAINAFITCYWSANILYSESTYQSIIETIKYFSIFNPLVFIALIFYIYKTISEKKILNISFLFSWLFTIILTSMSGNNFAHYAIVILPLLIYPITELVYDIKNFIIANNSNLFSTISIFICLLFVIFININSIFFNIKNEITPYSGHQELKNFIIENSTKQDKIIVIGAGDSLYLSTNRQAASRFFYQKPIVNKASSIITASEFIEDIDEKQPKFIILTDDLMLGLQFDWNVSEYLKSLVNNDIYHIIEEYDFNKNITIYQLVK